MRLADSCAELNKSKEQTDLRSYFTNGIVSGYCTTSDATTSDATTSDATISDATSSGLTTSNSLTKTLAQTIELASDYLAQLGVINLTSDSISKNDYDIGLIENLVKHFLDLIESPKNPLNSTILERSAAVQTSIVVTNQLFLAVNDIVELGWLEREYFGTSKTKWDGVLFKTGDHKLSPGFVEFSGGVNDATTPEKERCDVKKLYSMMIDVMNGYPAKVKKQIFCISTKIENTMFFEELIVHEEVTFRIQHAAIIVPRAARELVKFTSEIPKLIGWKDAAVKQIEQF
ncbi:hypothetical protein G6F43_009784 [Rhizopus delemar]|nr:hypothetical protein G6F43_009784 [Rhizopus delemar]